MFTSTNYAIFFTTEEPDGSYDGIFFIWVEKRNLTSCKVIVNPYNSSQRLNYFYWFAIGY